MQHAVRFDEPSRLKIHEVEQLAARDHRLLLAELLRADGVGDTGAMNVDERRLLGHIHRCRDGRDLHDEADLSRPRRSHLDELAARGEAGARQRQPVDAERQPIEGERSISGGLEGPMGLGAIAGERPARRQPEPGRVDHRHAKLAGRELRANGRRQQAEHGGDRPRQRAPFVTSRTGHPVYASSEMRSAGRTTLLLCALALAVASCARKETPPADRRSTLTVSVVGTNDLHGGVLPEDGRGGLGIARRLCPQSARGAAVRRRRRAAAGCRRSVSGDARVQPERRPGGRGRVQRARLCGRRRRQP